MNLRSIWETLTKNWGRRSRDGDPRKGCSGQWRPINADSILTVFAVIMVIIYTLLWKMHLPFLSFLLKLHSYTHGKQKELWKCTCKRCIKSSTQFLCWGCSVSIQAYGRILFLCFFFFCCCFSNHFTLNSDMWTCSKSSPWELCLSCSAIFLSKQLYKEYFFPPEGFVKQFESSIWENWEKCNHRHYNWSQFQIRWLKPQTSLISFSLCFQLL